MTMKTLELGAQDPELDTVISSGSTRLRCDHGLWIPAGPGGAGKP